MTIGWVREVRGRAISSFCISYFFLLPSPYLTSGSNQLQCVFLIGALLDILWLPGCNCDHSTPISNFPRKGVDGFSDFHS